MNGGEGNDLFRFDLGQRFSFPYERPPAVTIDGGAGFDTIEFGNAPANLSYSIGQGIYISGGRYDQRAQISTTMIERIVGSPVNDSISVTRGGLVVDGGLGDDWMNGYNSNADTSIAHGGLGNDTISGYFAAMYGDGGDDLFTPDRSGGLIDGGDGIDTLEIDGAANNTIDLAAGSGFFGGLPNAPASTIAGIENVTVLKKGYSLSSATTVYGDSGNNVLVMTGGNRNGTIAVELHGRGGNDTLIGEFGSDTLDGGDGDDTLDPGAGFNIVRGGDGMDTLVLGFTYDAASFAYGDGYVDISSYVTVPASNYYETDQLFAVTDRVSGVERFQFVDRLVETTNGRLSGPGTTTTVTFSDNSSRVAGFTVTPSFLNGGTLILDDKTAGNAVIYYFVLQDGLSGTFVLNGHDYSRDNPQAGEHLNLIAVSAALNVTTTAGVIAFSPLSGAYASGTATNVGVLQLGSGNDHVDLTGIANIILIAGAGDDTVIAGQNYVDGDAGNDIIDGRQSNLASLIRGGMGNDTIYGSDGDAVFTRLLGDDGDDTIYAGHAFAMGGEGDDTIFVGTHEAYGDRGNDTFHIGAGQYIVDGDDAHDRVIIQAGNSVDLLAQQAYFAGDANTYLAGIDDVQFVTGGTTPASSAAGTDGANILSVSDVASVAAVRFYGRGGDDVLTGGAGDDVLDGASGNDMLAGNAGSNTLGAGTGYDTVVLPYAFSDGQLQYGGSYVDLTGPAAGGGTSFNRVYGAEVFQFADRAIQQFDGHGLVDDLYYLGRYADTAASGQDADDAYAATGWQQGRDPNAFFSTAGYLAANPDVVAAAGDPLFHYQYSGGLESRDPSILFDTEEYLARNPDVAASGTNALEHYLLYGRVEGRDAYAAVGTFKSGPADPFGLYRTDDFDPEYYLLAHPEVAASGLTARQHYDQIGWHQGYDPNAYFDTSYYLAQNADVAAGGVNPLDHYQTLGWTEGRDPSALFDASAYLAANPDVAAANIDPLEHYLTYGRLEGRHNMPVEPAAVAAAAFATDAPSLTAFADHHLAGLHVDLTITQMLP